MVISNCGSSIVPIIPSPRSKIVTYTGQGCGVSVASHNRVEKIAFPTTPSRSMIYKGVILGSFLGRSLGQMCCTRLYDFPTPDRWCRLPVRMDRLMNERPKH